MQDITVFENSDEGTQAYTGYDAENDVIILAYRGSKNLENWINNLKFDLIDYDECSKCKVHKGFLQSYNSLKEKIFPAMKLLHEEHSTSKIYITGNSLGGAMSTLAAIDIHKNVAPIDTFYSFEAPRVGNKKFADYVNQLLPGSIRITHYKDIVVHLPPRIPLVGYYHSKTEVWYNEAFTEYTICPDDGESPNCADKYPLASSIKDHITLFGMNSGCDKQQDEMIDM